MASLPRHSMRKKAETPAMASRQATRRTRDLVILAVVGLTGEGVQSTKKGEGEQFA